MKLFFLFILSFILFGFSGCDKQWKMVISSPQNGSTVATSTINLKGYLYLSSSHKEDNEILSKLTKEQVEELRKKVPPLSGNIYCNNKKATIDRTNRTWLLNDLPLLQGSNRVFCYYQDSEGHTSQQTITVTYKPQSNLPPIASFTATPSSGNAPLNVHFDASSAYDQDGSIVKYEWIFSDQTTASGKIIDHLFATGGSYFITLTVTDNMGAQNSLTQSVFVQDDFDNSEQWSDGNLARVINVNDGFLPLETDIIYNLTNASIDPQANHLIITLNGQILNNNIVDLTSNQIKLNNIQLLNGKNLIEVSVEDDKGLPLLVTETLWAGNQEATINLVDSANNSLNDVDVELKLTKDQKVHKKIIHANSSITFTNLPNENFVITAKKGNLFGFVNTDSVTSLAQINLLGIKPASNISNDDFSLGTDGWDISQASPIIISHVENGVMRKNVKTDNDLRLSLENFNFQKITRTVVAGNQGKFYELRYRFKSIGSDAYLVAIRNATSGEVISESYNFDRLNDPNFQIWRTLTMVVSPGDLLQIEISIQKGGTRKQTQDFSFLDLDYTAFKKFKINSLEFLSGQGNDRFETPKADDKYIGIKGFSIGPRSEIYGNTKLEGNIVFSGAPASSITTITIQALQGINQATGNLLPSTQGLIGPIFGTGDLQALEKSLFEFTQASTQSFDLTTNIYLVVTALASNGDSDISYYPVSLKPLQQYQYTGPFNGNFRFGAITRDAIVGGDDWIQNYIKPYLDSLINQFFVTNQMQYNDASKMNGGYFKPHARHRAGEDVDLLIKDYYDAGLDQFNDIKQNGLNFIKMLEDYSHTKQVFEIGVEYSECGEFCKVIKYSCLKDGRYAKDVIKRWSGHDDHFHFSYTPISQERTQPDVTIAFPPTATKEQTVNIVGPGFSGGKLLVDWGDGQEDSAETCSLSHTYSTGGNKEIRVVYVKDGTCVGKTQTVMIPLNTDPLTACFTATPNNFGGATLNPSCSKGAVHKFHWETLPNGPANNQGSCGFPTTVTVGGLPNGTHSATLSIWGVDGTKKSITKAFTTSNGDKFKNLTNILKHRYSGKIILVCGASVSLPTANFSSLVTGPTGVEVNGNISSSSSEIQTYEWEAPNAVVTKVTTCFPKANFGFSSAGTYPVKLKITNADGITSKVKTLTVTVFGTGDK